MIATGHASEERSGSKLFFPESHIPKGGTNPRSRLFSFPHTLWSLSCVCVCVLVLLILVHVCNEVPQWPTPHSYCFFYYSFKSCKKGISIIIIDILVVSQRPRVLSPNGLPKSRVTTWFVCRQSSAVGGLPRQAR